MPVMRAIRRPIPDVRTSAAAAQRGGSPAARPESRILASVRHAAAACDAPAASFSDDGKRLNRASTPVTGLGGMRGSSNGGGSDDLRNARDADFDLLVENAIAAILAAGDRPDPVFGPFAELNSLVRAVTYHEGRLLEQGMARLAAENPSLRIMPSETALPIVPAALEMLARNEWRSLKGIRLRSEVHHKASYVPDLFIVDAQAHRALIADMKRSLASYPERRLDALRRRMMAAALIAADWLHIEGKVAGVTSVEVAIVDGSSERRDHGSGIFPLDEIGELIEVGDAGEAMLELRAKFACRVQEEIGAACLRALGGDDVVGEDAADRESADDAADDDGDAEADADDEQLNPDDEDGSSRTIAAFGSEPVSAVVGFARGRER
ncbi:hypothetical protein NYR54_18390 [Chelativorans sp. SCAU2101]|uniref:Uncharacterized protein n=1 Tax=Chelativorans petroleitrophicus TaxID=2975484 RepID=A0A9X3B0V4_9HYPH|nr:hypothetical protein [Chelativorans petroleitrophicus]MCT8992224.1 hypothetical protein [Chelativorans petroleitrophicus]